MKNDYKYILIAGSGLIALINGLLLHSAWQKSPLSKEDKITYKMRKLNI